MNCSRFLSVSRECNIDLSSSSCISTQKDTCFRNTYAENHSSQRSLSLSKHKDEMGFSFAALYKAPEVNPVNRKARSVPMLNPIDPYGRVFFFSWFGFMVAFWAWYSTSNSPSSLDVPSTIVDDRLVILDHGLGPWRRNMLP